MIITEFYREREDGVRLMRTYSDKNVYIHGGFPESDYQESIDPEYLHRTFTETDIPIETEDEIPAEQALSIITGGIT